MNCIIFSLYAHCLFSTLIAWEVKLFFQSNFQEVRTCEKIRQFNVSSHKAMNAEPNYFDRTVRKNKIFSSRVPGIVGNVTLQRHVHLKCSTQLITHRWIRDRNSDLATMSWVGIFTPKNRYLSICQEFLHFQAMILCYKLAALACHLERWFQHEKGDSWTEKYKNLFFGSICNVPFI